MGKRKKQNTAPAQSEIAHSLEYSLRNTQDGKQLVREHLALGPAAVILSLLVITSDLQKLVLSDPRTPPQLPAPMLDYFEEALKVVGLPQIAGVARADLASALVEFSMASDIATMEKHAKSMQLLMSF